MQQKQKKRKQNTIYQKRICSIELMTKKIEGKTTAIMKAITITIKTTITITTTTTTTITTTTKQKS